MKSYKKTTRAVEIELELINGEKKVLSTKLDTAQKLQDFMLFSTQREASIKDLEGFEKLAAHMNVQADELSMIFGEPAETFLQNFDAVTMGNIISDTLGEFLTGKKS